MRIARPRAWGRCLFCLLAMAVTGPLPVVGQETLTLEQAREIARRQNPVLLRARAIVDAARGEKLQLQALEDPVLVWEFEEADGPDAFNAGEQRLGLSQFLEFPGKRGLRGEIGEDGIEISRAVLGLLEALLERQVAAGYYAVVRDVAAERLLEESGALLDQFAEIVRARYGANLAPYADVVRAELERARLDNERIGLRRRISDGKIRLNLLLGRAGDVEFELPDSLSYDPLVQPLEEFVTARTSSSYTLRAAQLGFERSRKALRLARMTNLPDFEVGAGYQRLEGDGETEGFLSGEIALNLPFWRTRQRGSITRAEAEVGIATAEVEGLRERVRADVARAHREAAAAGEQVEVFRNRILVEAENALETAIDAYQVGAVDGLVLIDLYRTGTEIRLEYLTALENYLTARARLATSGEIPGLDLGVE